LKQAVLADREDPSDLLSVSAVSGGASGRADLFKTRSKRAESPTDRYICESEAL
jgi:hypothetical protein